MAGSETPMLGSLFNKVVGTNACNSIRNIGSQQKCSVRKGVLRNFAKCTGNTCARVSFLIKF